MTFREITKRQVFETLDKSEFGAFAFEIIYPGDTVNGKQQQTFKILYIGDNKFFFEIYELYDSTSHTNKRMYRSSPGRYLHSEPSKDFTTFDDVFSDMRLNAKVDANDFSYFTLEEVSGLKQKIDNLYINFEELKEKSDLKDVELKTIKQELEKLKASLNVLPRNAWYKSGGKKIINLIGKYLNPDTVKALGTEVVKGLLDNK
jgi:hypothetical protein